MENSRTEYEAHKEQVRARHAEHSLEGRDIGKPPKIPRLGMIRRKAGMRDFRTFCLTYFPWSFVLRFSEDHLKVIAKIETSVLDGGLFAVAMPRGSGKTTLSECACLWALLYGHRSFVVLIGADEGAAGRMLESIKLELETNELLATDFPEVCYPIGRLERIANRCKGQLSEGEPTFITWTGHTIVLPTIKGSKASGGVAMIGGLTASIRGLKFKRADGIAVRPDLVVIDDPQTDESARSASQCAYRERVLSGAVLGMAGPGKKIAGVMPCTVIAPGDLADNLLSLDKHPEWRGERTQLIYSLPTNQELWRQYANIRADSLRKERGGVDATEFYKANRDAMDAGAVVAWPERFEPDCLSAIQYAMNLKIDRPEVFAAEYQNSPLPLVDLEPGNLTADEILDRINQTPRGIAPTGATHLTAFIDVQQDLLYYCVCGWQEGFGGAIIDYGTYPDQRRSYFTLAEAHPTLAEATGVPSVEGSIYAGLVKLCDMLLSREWQLQNGGVLKIEKLLIDSGWQTDTVRRFVRQSPHGSLLLPSKGMAIGAAHVPIHEWDRKQNTRRFGFHWCIDPPEVGKGRSVTFDANSWKSFIAARLRQPMGEPGCLTLFGADSSVHRMLADHCTAEFMVKTFGRGREVQAWQSKPHRPDNHWWDCLIGCAVAASILGMEPGGVPKSARPATTRVSWAEMQQKARAGG